MMKRTMPCVIALLITCLFGAVCVSAQTGTQTTTTTTTAAAPASTQSTTDASSDSVDSADLAITATVTARELRFDAVPNPTVEFTGSHERKTVWEAERENLPRPVEPGVTYRNIGIRLKITSVFADIDRIVAEALGEVPNGSDAPRDENAAPPDATSTPPSTAPQPTTAQPQGGTPR